MEILELRKELKLSRKEFCELYEIPYITVTQWERGERTPPAYLIKLIKENIRLKTNGIQESINLMQPKYVYCWIQPSHVIPLRLRRFTNEEEFDTDKMDPFWDKRYKEETMIKDVEVYRYTLCNETRVK